MIQDWLIAATLISCVVATAGLFVAIAGQRSQMATQIMMQYSDKFRTMLHEMPLEILAATRNSTLPESNTALTFRALSVFYVLLELHYLRQKHYLPKDVWNLWLPNVETVIGSPFFMREWQQVRPEFATQTSFCLFVDSLQRERRTSAAGAAITGLRA
jgi:hypothetical protein